MNEKLIHTFYRALGSRRALFAAAFAGIVGCLLVACNFLSMIFVHQGEDPLSRMNKAQPKGPHVLVFCLDGTGHDQLIEAIESGRAPRIKALLGRDIGRGLFEHGYSSSGVVSVLPSSTVADWTATFTGSPPAWNGIAGDEFFVREKMRFYAPVPVSVKDAGAFAEMLADDVVGTELKAPTLFQQVGPDSYVSLLMVYKGATLFILPGPLESIDLFGEFVAGALIGESPEKSISGSIDLDSAQKAAQAIQQHGLPKLQVVYFPGIDIYTHRTAEPLHSQMNYLERVTDQGVGAVLAAYDKLGALDDTYVLFVADHGNTPTLNEPLHALGVQGDDTPFGVLAQAGFRVRDAVLNLPPNAQDYQAVIAYQGFMANIYLADRSTCPNKGDRCDWSKPPRFEEDVMPVVKAMYRAAHDGSGPASRMNDAIDLVMSRNPAPIGPYARPFEIFDGSALVPISRYLEEHSRPDLVDLDERMRWLGAGPYGDRAGDVVMLAAASMSAPIQDRYYFAVATHYSWHGSANHQDSYIPFILAKHNGPGLALQQTVEGAIRASSRSQMALTPLVRDLLTR
jgi:hypothetical protein